MVGEIITDTGKTKRFSPWTCEFCCLDSAGNHMQTCPYYYKDLDPEIVDLVNDNFMDLI